MIGAALARTELPAEDYPVYVLVGAEGPWTPTGLARRLEMPLSTMLFRLGRLERRGHAERVPNPDDRRSYLIRLTDEEIGCSPSASCLPRLRRAVEGRLGSGRVEDAPRRPGRACATRSAPSSSRREVIRSAPKTPRGSRGAPRGRPASDRAATIDRSRATPSRGGRRPARSGRRAGRRGGWGGRSSRTPASRRGRTSRAGSRSPRAPRSRSRSWMSRSNGERNVTRSGIGPSLASGCASRRPRSSRTPSARKRFSLVQRDAPSARAASRSRGTSARRDPTALLAVAADDGDLAARAEELEHQAHLPLRPTSGVPRARGSARPRSRARGAAPARAAP